MRKLLSAAFLAVLACGMAYADDDVCPALTLLPGKTHLVLKAGTAELPQFGLHCPHDAPAWTGHVIGNGSIKSQTKTTTAFVGASYFVSFRGPTGQEISRYEFPTQIDFCSTCHPDGSNAQNETFDFTVPLPDGVKLSDCKLEMGWVSKKN